MLEPHVAKDEEHEKTGYFIKYSINMMLVTSIIVLNIKSLDLT